jgi:hypothetical protein
MKGSNVLLIVVLAIAAAGFGFYALHDPRPKRLDDGLASASGEDSLTHPCAGKVPDGAYSVMLGDSALWFRTLPHTIATLNGNPVFTLDRKPDGTIAVDLAIFAQGRQLGRLQGVTLTDNQAGLVLARPSGSEIIVSTADGTPVVQIDRPSNRALTVTGHLAFGTHDLTIPPGDFQLDGKAQGNACLAGDKPVDFAF